MRFLGVNAPADPAVSQSAICFKTSVKLTRSLVLRMPKSQVRVPRVTAARLEWILLTFSSHTAMAEDLKQKALELYATTTTKAVEIYGTAADSAGDFSEIAIAKVGELREQYPKLVPYLHEVSMEEFVMIGCAVLPLLCATFSILRLLCCCCCPKKAKVSPSPPSPPAKKGGAGASPPGRGKANGASPAQAPPLVTRKSVVQRGKKDAPDGSIGHPGGRGQAVKNPKPPGPGKPGQTPYMA